MSMIGESKLRYAGLDYVTGKVRYTDDVIIPGALQIKAFRSPIHKGKILKLDTSKAEKLPGVVGVITAADVPCNSYGFLTLDQPLMAEKNIRYKGEPIAAVAAINAEIANAALELIKLEVEEEEPVFDVFEAMKPDAPRVRPEGNILRIGDGNCRRVVLGDIEKGFEEAEEIIEENYMFPSQEHAPLETQVSVAVPESDGRLTIYTVSQGLYFHLKQLHRIFGQGEDVSDRWSPRVQYRFRGKLGYCDIKYVGGKVGGGFGGKSDLHADPITALLALKTGRPCKWRWTREEEMLFSTRHSPWYMTIKDGFTRDGRIVARQTKTIHDAGSHTGLSSYVVDKHSYFMGGPYYIPNICVESYVVYTNTTPTGAIRGFGLTPSTFATEVQMDRIAEKLGLDPWELRIKNFMKNGDQIASRQAMHNVYMAETFLELAKWTGKELPSEAWKANSNSRL